MDGSIYRSARASSLPPSRSLLFDDDGDMLPARYRKATKSRVMFEDESSSSEAIMRTRPVSSYEAAVRYEMRKPSVVWRDPVPGG